MTYDGLWQLALWGYAGKNRRADAFDLPPWLRGHTRGFELHSAAACSGRHSPRRHAGCYAEPSILALQGRGLHGAFGLLKCKTSPSTGEACKSTKGGIRL